MKFLKYILAVWLLSFSIAATAQTILIKGVVYDLQTHQPIPGVTVQTDSGQAFAQSNINGYFEIKSKTREGKITLTAIGYKTALVSFDDSKKVLNIPLQPAPHTLNEVRISAFGNNKTIQETSGAISFLSGAQIKQGSGISLQSALNSIPGVQMDQSNLEDSRISIRGNGVRSPWGIRDVKIYINGIPLTETDGTTRIEALDVADLGQAVVIKGPASSIYGGGVGGVIKFELEKAPYEEQSLEASALAGSFGLSRMAITYRGSTDKMNSFVSYGQQYYSGYREHSRDERKFLTANFQWFPSNDRMITLLLSRSSQNAQIPGAITQDQMKENPRQAAEEDLDAQAGRIQNWTRVGIGQKYRLNPMLSNSTSVFTYFYDLHHPLPFGILRNFYQSYGGRTQFNFDPKFRILPTTFTFGGEFDQALTKENLFVNSHGQEGNLMADEDFNNTVFFLFFQSETKIGKIANLDLGVSYNGLTYNVTDYLHPGDDGIKKFNPQASPRIALSHDFGKLLTLSGSISTGFSPPSSDQITNADQTLNKNIQAEKGINYEVDAKGNFFKDRLGYDLSLFKMDMRGELIAQTVSQALTIYHNSGKTTHNGMELALSWRALQESDKKEVSLLRPYLAVSYSDFKFKDYQTLNAANEVIASYDGNELTGIAPWTVNAGVDLETRLGIYVHLNYYFSDKSPLNDANTDYNPSYSILDAKVGYKMDLGKRIGLEAFVGLNNITNSKYSSFTVLNALGVNGQPPAYFNPNPTRNGYVGLNLKYYLKPKNK